MCPSWPRKSTLSPRHTKWKWKPSANTTTDNLNGAQQGCQVCPMSWYTRPYPGDSCFTLTRMSLWCHVSIDCKQVAKTAWATCKSLLWSCFKLMRVVGGHSSTSQGGWEPKIPSGKTPLAFPSKSFPSNNVFSVSFLAGGAWTRTSIAMVSDVVNRAVVDDSRVACKVLTGCSTPFHNDRQKCLTVVFKRFIVYLDEVPQQPFVPTQDPGYNYWSQNTMKGGRKSKWKEVLFCISDLWMGVDLNPLFQQLLVTLIKYQYFHDIIELLGDGEAWDI